MTETRRRSDFQIERLAEKVDDLYDGISKAQLHANDAHMSSAETFTIVQQFIKTTDQRYAEGREDHKAMWERIDEHSKFQNHWKGFMAAITFIAAAVGALFMMAFNYFTGHIKP